MNFKKIIASSILVAASTGAHAGGMVAAAGMNVLSEVKMTRRNMVIIAISLTAGLGLNLVPTAVQYLPGIWKTLATSAVAPTAFLAIALNQILPEDME